MIATTELAERVSFIYHELTALCQKLNKNVLNLNYEILNDNLEFVGIRYRNNLLVKVEVTELQNCQMVKQVLDHLYTEREK